MVTAAQKAESEWEDKGINHATVKAAWAEKDEIICGLQEQTAQLRAAIHEPQKKTSNCDKHNANQTCCSDGTIGRNYYNRHSKYNENKIQCYHCEEWGHVVHECPNAL